jgi:hypothetical protein
MFVEPPDKSTSAVDRVLDLLERVTKSPNGWSARCPAHEDKHPSLSVAAAEDGGVLVHCFAGCPRDEIVSALGLHERDLQPRRPKASPRGGSGRPVSTGVTAADPDKVGLTLADLAAAKRLPIEFLRSLGCADDRGPSVRIPYHDADGTLVAIRTRLAITGDRFRWRKGDRPLPYGLWRLADARAAGWLLLVEGETDCWTLWDQGIPTLGIPGKSTWRAGWAEFVKGFDAFLWQEPDAEDLVDRVARDLPDVRVFVAPPGIKDVSDAHVRGDDVATLVDRLRAEATPVHELREQRARERQLAAHEAAQPILAHPDPLELVEAEIRAQGYGGDLRVPLLGYLAATSRLLAPRRGSIAAHMLFIGPSSGGKNAAMQAGLRLLPAEAVHVIDAGSPRVLIYDDAPLEHRVVVFGEADSLPAGEDNPAASAIRNLLQDGHLHYQVTVHDPATGAFTVHKVDKPGPTVLMTTSTRPLGRQLMTRLFTAEVPDEPAQLRAALAAQAALELDDPPAPNEGLVDLQRYLGSLAPIDVVVPFADVLQTSLGLQASGPRVLRDFPRLLSLIKAAAIVRIARRTRDARGRLIATIEDYRAVYRLVADAYEASAGASKRIRDAVAAVADLTAARGPGSTVTVSELANQEGISVPSAWRRVRDAVAAGWLVNDEPRPRQTAQLRLGEPLPANSGLPTPEELAARFEPASAEIVKTETAGAGRPVSDRRLHAPGVFTSTPDPAIIQPLALTDAEGGGRHSPVDAANVKTVGRSLAEEPLTVVDPPAISESIGDEWIDVTPVPPEPDPDPPSLWELR